MPAKARWCDHIEPVTVAVPCGGQQHNVTWRRGKVVLEDHDLGAERTMLALGGELPHCLRLLQLWRNLHAWAMSAELFRQMQARLSSETLLAPGGLGRVHQLGLLLTWERAWRRSAYFSEHERLLHEQLRERALGPLRQHVTFWKELLGSRRISSVEVQVQRPGKPPVLVGSMDRVGARATATLGVSWILRVWGRGLAVVDGAFVLEVEDQGESEPAVWARAARWEEQRGGYYAPVAAPARLTRDDEGGWCLRWLES